MDLFVLRAPHHSIDTRQFASGSGVQEGWENCEAGYKSTDGVGHKSRKHHLQSTEKDQRHRGFSSSKSKGLTANSSARSTPRTSSQEVSSEPFHRSTRNFSLGPHSLTAVDHASKTVEAFCDQLAFHPLLEQDLFGGIEGRKRKPISLPRTRSTPTICQTSMAKDFSSDSSGSPCNSDLADGTVPCKEHSPLTPKATTRVVDMISSSQSAQYQPRLQSQHVHIPATRSVGDSLGSRSSHRIGPRLRQCGDLTIETKTQNLSLDMISAGTSIKSTDTASGLTEEYSCRSNVFGSCTPSNGNREHFSPGTYYSWTEGHISNSTSDVLAEKQSFPIAQEVPPGRLERLALPLFRKIQKRSKDKAYKQELKTRQLELNRIIRTPVKPCSPAFSNETKEATAERFFALRQAYGRNLSSKKVLEVLGVNQNTKGHCLVSPVPSIGLPTMLAEVPDNTRLCAWVGEQRNIYKATVSSESPTTKVNFQDDYENETTSSLLSADTSPFAPVSGLQDVGRARKIFHTSTETRKFCVAPRSDSNGRTRFTPVRSTNSVNGSIVLPSHAAFNPEYSSTRCSDSDNGSNEETRSGHSMVNFMNLTTSEDEVTSISDLANRDCLCAEASASLECHCVQPNKIGSLFGYTSTPPGSKGQSHIDSDTCSGADVEEPLLVEQDLEEETSRVESELNLPQETPSGKKLSPLDWDPLISPSVTSMTPLSQNNICLSNKNDNSNDIDTPNNNDRSLSSATPPAILPHTVCLLPDPEPQIESPISQTSIETARSVPIFRSVPVIQDLRRSPSASPPAVKVSRRAAVSPASPAASVSPTSSAFPADHSSPTPARSKSSNQGSQAMFDVRGELDSLVQALQRFEGNIRLIPRRLSGIAEEELGAVGGVAGNEIAGSDCGENVGDDMEHETEEEVQQGQGQDQDAQEDGDAGDEWEDCSDSDRWFDDAQRLSR